MSPFKIKATKHPKHTREFEVLVDWEKVSSMRDNVFAELASDIAVPGFRKGSAPKSMVAKYINPEKLYDTTARKILPEIYKELIDSEKINPVTTPSVELLEAKDNEAWKFKVLVAEIPEVKIKDYKKKVQEAHAKAAQTNMKHETSNKKGDESKETGDSGVIPAEAGANAQDSSSPVIPAEAGANAQDSSSPVIPAKAGIHDSEKSKKVINDKKTKATLQDIFKILLSEAEVEIPDLLISEEVGRRMEQLQQDVKRVGLTEEQYLASKNLKLEELKEQHAKDAIEMYRLEFILAEIAKNEGIKVEASELDVLMTGAKTDKEREIAAQNMEWYAGILRKQKVLDFLNDL